MGVRINTNTAALQLQYNLDKVSGSLNKSLQRLSSGERITRAGDDVSGLAASQALRYDIRGIQQNVRNVNDGVSIISTTESVMGQATDMLNRIRELAISAGSATMTDQNRKASDIEVQELIDEMNTLAANSEFNGKKLLDGSFENMRIQTGTASGQFISFSISSMMASALGAVARVTGDSGVSTTPVTDGDGLTINGIKIPPTTDDTLSAQDGAASAVAKAKAINQVSGQTGVTAKAEPAEVAGVTPISAISINGAETSLVINGIYMGSINAAEGDSTGALVARINMHSHETGVTASVGGGGNLLLQAKDGRNISIDTKGGVAQALGLTDGADNVTIGGKISLSSPDPINVGGDPLVLGLSAAQTATELDPNSSLENSNILTYENSQNMIETVDAALKSIISGRAALGAIQNRLQSSAESLATMVEDLSASDDRIRSTDFAQETAQYTRDQIIQDASVAILAQANSMPRSILEILMQ